MVPALNHMRCHDMFMLVNHMLVNHMWVAFLPVWVRCWSGVGPVLVVLLPSLDTLFLLVLCWLPCSYVLCRLPLAYTKAY